MRARLQEQRVLRWDPNTGSSSGICATASRVKSDVKTACEMFPRCDCHPSHHFNSVVFQVLAINASNAGEAMRSAVSMLRRWI